MHYADLTVRAVLSRDDEEYASGSVVFYDKGTKFIQLEVSDHLDPVLFSVQKKCNFPMWDLVLKWRSIPWFRLLFLLCHIKRVVLRQRCAILAGAHHSYAWSAQTERRRSCQWRNGQTSLQECYRSFLWHQICFAVHPDLHACILPSSDRLVATRTEFVPSEDLLLPHLYSFLQICSRSKCTLASLLFLLRLLMLWAALLFFWLTEYKWTPDGINNLSVKCMSIFRWKQIQTGLQGIQAVFCPILLHSSF